LPAIKRGQSRPSVISVLAYQCVQLIRRQLKEKGIEASWGSLRETLTVQRRVTASFKRKDGGHAARA